MPTARHVRHARLSTVLAGRADAELVALVDTVDHVGVGGGSAVVTVDGDPVFAKRIPLTERELARPRGTSNLFDLPMFCQYGVISPGFNAWRELAANLVVTDGVLAGETESFPLLYHWRVLPGPAPVAAEHADVDAVVAAVGGSPGVRARLEALAAASHSLVLFSEYIPHPVDSWLWDDPASTAEALELELSRMVTFLRRNELLHMDGHFGNMRTDGDRLYLTDFGLATSPRFELSAVEREFVRRNATHDAAYAAMRLVNWLVTAVCGVPAPPDRPPVARNEFVRRCAAGHLPNDLPPTIAAILVRHAPTAAKMNDFYWRLFAGEIHTVYEP